VEVCKVADKNISQKASLPCQQELTIWFGGEKKLAESRITLRTLILILNLNKEILNSYLNTGTHVLEFQKFWRV
jgi:hypothetical protein